MAYVDPWGSVAREFQKDSSGASHIGGAVESGGTAETYGNGARGSGSRTANSSASA